MKRALRISTVFASFFLTLFGIVLMARALEIAVVPFAADLTDWNIYHLALTNTFQFFAGCAIAAASLTSLWGQRSK
jgi:hypothetical protein